MSRLNPAKPVLLFSVLLLMQTFFASAAVAQGFSADMVANVAGGKDATGKIYISGDNSRIESGGVVTITRTHEKLAWILLPSFKVYLEHPITPEMSPATGKFPGETARTFLGKDTVEGRQAKKYIVTFQVKDKKETVYCWIDDEFGAPIKTVSLDGEWRVIYRNIKPGKQPDSLFELPRGYRKLILGRHAPSEGLPDISNPGGKKSVTMLTHFHPV